MIYRHVKAQYCLRNKETGEIAQISDHVRTDYEGVSHSWGLRTKTGFPLLAVNDPKIAEDVRTRSSGNRVGNTYTNPNVESNWNPDEWEVVQQTTTTVVEPITKGERS